MYTEFPLDVVHHVIGKTIAKVEPNPNADEGFIITFTDGHILGFGFSGCEGSIWTMEAE